MKYSMTCTCGHTMEVDGETRDEAVTKLQGIMSEEALKAHYDEKHPGETPPTKEASDHMIEQNTKPVMTV